MRLRNCKRCGKPYETDRPDAYFCPACSLEAKRATVIRDRVCRQCGAVFSGGPRAWYCPDCRADRQKDAAKRYNRLGPARKIGSTDICKNCGCEYTVNSARQVYCKDCADSAVKEAVRPQKRAYNAEHRELLNEHKRVMRAGRKVCVICGNVFDADTGTITCSASCAAELLRRRRQKADARRNNRGSQVDANAGDKKEPSATGKNTIDLSGQRFGRLIALHPTEKRSGYSVVWRCKCDCGKTVDVSSNSLRTGNTRSCGCLREEIHTGDTPGVVYIKSRDRYNAYITHNGRQYHLGSSPDINEALAMRAEAEKVDPKHFDAYIAALRSTRKRRKKQ